MALALTNFVRTRLTPFGLPFKIQQLRAQTVWSLPCTYRSIATDGEWPRKAEVIAKMARVREQDAPRLHKIHSQILTHEGETLKRVSPLTFCIGAADESCFKSVIPFSSDRRKAHGTVSAAGLFLLRTL